MDQALEQVVEIVANVDDATGETIGAAVEALLAEGSLDVWTTAIMMKKGRPGVVISLLCRPDDRDRLARRLIELTGTFGVRYRMWDRLVANRRYETVSTEYGDVRIKVGSVDGQEVVRKVEFADVQRLASEHGVTVQTVISAAHGQGTSS